MSTYTQILYQLVFSTKNRQPVLKSENRRQLYKYIWGIMKNNKCRLYRINGVEDHLHIVAHLHPAVALARLVKDIKIASNKYIVETKLFPGFSGWQTGYSAFTYSVNEKQQLIEYVKNQEAHHKNMSYREELQMLLKKHGIEFDEKYLL